MVAHHKNAGRVIALTCIALALSGCAARDAIGGLFSKKDEERPEPVPISQPKPYKDGVEFPVRQPFPANGAGQREVDSGSVATRLRADAPDRYTVVRGDTLWDISGKFLSDPWYWPEIWQANKEIANPHLIYPGDVLRLVWIDGKPRIVRDNGENRMGPQIRVQSLEQAVDTIPFEAIAGFLSRPTVIADDQLDGLPYIVDIKESHLVAGSGFTVYVRGTDAPAGTRFNIFNIGDIYRDPETGKRLGHEALYVGTGRLEDSGDVARLFLTDTVREALRGDRLLLETPAPTANFLPRAPEVLVDGRIISVVDGVQLIGQYQIVVINRGTEDGIEPGQVLSIFQSGRTAIDRWSGKRSLWGIGPRERVQLPDEHAGEMMIFKTESELSFALVMSAISEIHVGDTVRNPI
ncbi:MAG: LysM peptidoglycan-binding domain-containing protein [Gammaproteobacteria bacterium]